MAVELDQVQVGDADPVVAEVESVVVTTSLPAHTTAHHTDTFTSDPYAERREGTVRIQKGIHLAAGILEGLLAIRFVIGLLGAGQGAGFSRFVFGVTGLFIAPFEGLFGTSSFDGNVFEWNALAAIVVYALLSWVLVKAVGLVMGETRRGVRTTSSQVDTRNG